MLKRTCTACNIEYPATTEHFYTDKSVKSDGLASKCKLCRTKQLSSYRETNRDDINKRAREAYTANIDKQLARRKEYREQNREKLRARGLKYYDNNKERFAQTGKLYRDLNPDKVRDRHQVYYSKNSSSLKTSGKIWSQSERGKLSKNLSSQRRRNARKSVPTNFTANDWELCIDNFNGECAYCGKAKKLTYEHFVPLSKGGEFTINNIIPVCDSCNKSKNNRNFFDWYPKFKYYSKQREKKILAYLNYNPKTHTQQFALALS